MKDGINKKQKFKDSNPHTFNFKNIVFLLNIIIIFLSIKITGERFRVLKCFASEIHLIITGGGNQRLLNETFYLNPSRVSANGQNIDSFTKVCELGGGENNVTLFFDNLVTSGYSMFSGLNNIKRIDLSDFDFSLVTTMSFMFNMCTNLETIIFGDINTSSVKEMISVFQGCNNLISVDVSKFDTSIVISMANMFHSCYKLSSIDISNFETSNVLDLHFLFYECKILKSINLGNMDTSLVTSMYASFGYCYELESIDLTSFNTSSVTSMGWMFSKCYEIKTIKFSEKFDTSNVNDMSFMFLSCNSITSLNLSHFNTTKVTKMNEMFNNCAKLKYLNISNFNPLNIQTIQYMFRNLSSLIYLNIYSFEIKDETNIDRAFELTDTNVITYASKEKMINLLTNNHFINNCSHACFDMNIKLDIVNNECINSCKIKGYNYEHNNICYQACPEGIHAIYNDNDANVCLDNKPNDYYLDNGFYKKCYESCKSCSEGGNEKNHNCLECKLDYQKLNDSIYPNNCYSRCSNYYYYNETNDYICTETKNCSGKYNKLIKEKNKCIDNCENEDIYRYEYNNICYEHCPNGTIYNEEEHICFENRINTNFISTINNDLNIIQSTSIIINTSNIIQNEIIDTTNYLLNNINSITTEIMVQSMILKDNSISFSLNEEIQNKFSDIKTNQQISMIGPQIESNKEIFQMKTITLINGNNDDIYEEVIKNVINNYDISKGEDIIIPGENDHIFHVTNSQNELELLEGRKNNSNKCSVIDLGQCGNLLKNYYKINNDTSLIIIKFEKITNISSKRSLQYEVYEPFNKTKLDLSICDNITIDV